MHLFFNLPLFEKPCSLLPTEEKQNSPVCSGDKQQRRVYTGPLLPDAAQKAFFQKMAIRFYSKDWWRYI